MAFNVNQTLRKVNSLLSKGELDAARQLCLSILGKFPNNKRARKALSLIDSGLACDRNPFKKPSQEELQTLLTLYEGEKFSTLCSHAGRLLDLYPGEITILNFLGAGYVGLREWENAEATFRKVIEIDENYVDGFNNVGNALREQGRLDDALSFYHSALRINPNRLDILHNIGSVLKKKHEYKESLSYYGKALRISPEYVDSLIGIGGSYKELGEIDKAIGIYSKALKISPNNPKVESQLIGLRQQICDFNVFSTLPQVASRLGIETEAIPPFSGLSWVDDPGQQLLRSKRWARERFSGVSCSNGRLRKKRFGRIRVGYFSADFHDHATMFLMAGLFRKHNIQQFEVFAYSYGSTKTGSWRNLVEDNIEKFFDVEGFSDQNILDLVRSHDLDISIDLKGYTRNTRSEMFAYKLAPVQVNFLGYPGSMGADFIDYIIGDSVVIPGSTREFYSESVIYLPDSYMPNDNARGISNVVTRRSDFGLPDDCFVFCCFNNNYKISQKEFNIWMRIMSQVKNSVLWLFKDNEHAKNNLFREAEIRGVDSSRLIFADRLPHSEHLARHQHADLFLDTFNYNAHTTASDALWAGLPVVTKQGEQFSARVASSLLHAVGLPELVTRSEKDYEYLILELASNPKKLASIRFKLAENRHTRPLFDTEKYTRNFERGLLLAYERYLEGKEPNDIWVSDV